LTDAVSHSEDAADEEMEEMTVEVTSPQQMMESGTDVYACCS